MRSIVIVRSVNIGSVLVGDDQPTAFMAETGTFFNKDIEKAINYLLFSKKIGVDIFKTEILHNPEICLKNTGLKAEYKYANGVGIEDYRSLIERKVNSLENYKKLYDFSHSIGMPIVASVYDCEGVDFVRENNGSAIKISRDNINNIGLIKHASRTGIPIIFDVGEIYLDEISLAIRLARDFGANNIIINHHPGLNPAPAEVQNLKMINYYKEIFNVPVGLVGYYIGDEVLYTAIGSGCNIIEKGVDEDPTRKEQDLVSACSFDELEDIVRKVKNCSKALGTKYIKINEPRKKKTWKCLSINKDMSPGHIIEEGDLTFSWPPIGICASMWDTVIGAKVKNKLISMQPIHFYDLEFIKSNEKI
jgi:sialic acid synthase SpsE